MNGEGRLPHRDGPRSPHDHYSYRLATKPIEGITIASNNGHITIPLNTIELQSIHS